MDKSITTDHSNLPPEEMTAHGGRINPMPQTTNPRRLGKKTIRQLINRLDEAANGVSNTRRPRLDNNYGRAAQALEDLIKPWGDNATI